MGNTITTSNPSDFSSRQQTYFSRQLLKALDYNLRISKYGLSKELPANSGGDTIRFFRPRKANRTSVVALTEGTTPTNLTEVAVGYVDCQLKQRGALAKVTDLVRAIDLFDTLELYSKTMGADAAYDFDAVVTRSICSKAGTADQDGTASPFSSSQVTLNASNSSFERFAGVTPTLVSATDFASLGALSAAQAKMTRIAHLGAMTRMKGVGATPAVPMINGRYPVLVPPEVLFDIRQDSTWIQAAVFNPEKLKLYQWAEFELDGGVFVEHNTPFIEKVGGTYGVYDTTGGVDGDSIYSVLYIGEGAFGVPKLSSAKAGGDPRAPSLIINDKPDKYDALNQITTIGWKAYYGSILLKTSVSGDQFYVTQLRCKTTFA